MAREGSLRGRIVAAFTLLALAVCGFFAVVGYFTVEEVELHLVEERLRSFARWQVKRPHAGADASLPAGVAFYAGERMPAVLRPLAIGFHQVARPDATWHVVIGAAPDGARYAMVDEESDFEHIERELLIGFGLGIAASVLLAALLGRAIAGRVIAPVTALADAVREDRLAEASPALVRNDEIGVLGRAFAARADELRQFLVRERLFTGDVSHELRTPLTVIIGAAEVLATRVGSQAEAAAPLERIQRTARDTADRVAALLLLSRTPQAIDAPRTALWPLVEREIERCRPLLAGKPVQIVPEPSDAAWALVHPELAGMAIGNLLRNACQYTERGRIRIGLEPGALTIEDNGLGLPEAVRAQLFERFVRGAHDTEGGSGLGLAIVKRIVEHLRWRIDYEVPEGGGSRFVLRFASA